MPVETPEQVNADKRANELQRESAFKSAMEQLPHRQQKLALVLLTQPNKSLTQKLRLAGYRGNDTKQVKKLEGKLGDALFELGVTRTDLVVKLHEMLNAVHHRPHNVPEVNKKGKVTSYRVEIITTPNYPIRAKAVELLIKLGGYMPAEKFKGEMKKTIEHTLSKEAMAALMARERHQNSELPAEFSVGDTNAA